MRYIGSKTATLPAIEAIIAAHASQATSLCDPFAGTCTVARHFKKRGLRIETGDLLWTSYVLQRGTITLNTMPQFAKLIPGLSEEIPDKVAPADLVVNQLNRLVGRAGYITEFFSNHGEQGRRYFTGENAAKIDAIRTQIFEWRRRDLIDLSEEAYLLACLLHAADRVANTAGTYMAHLKFWSRKALRPIALRTIPIDDNGAINRSSRADARQTSQTDADILYLDPPYNSRDYSFYYHLPETIVLWDGIQPTGKSGVPAVRRHPPSDFCVRRRAAPALDDLLRHSKARFVVFHYSVNGLIRHHEIMEILRTRGDTDFHDVAVRAYCSRPRTSASVHAHHRIYWCKSEHRSG